MEIIGIDIGATKIAFGRVKIQDTRYKIQDTIKIKTPKERRKAVKVIIENIRKLLTEKVKGIGIGMPGPLDRQRGIIHFAPNLSGWKNLDLKKPLEKEFKIPVFFDNDANCFALAESRFGAAKNLAYVVGLTIGSGLGGGIIIDGSIYHGADFAGEIGHMTIDPNGPKCGCGNRGCLEVYVSGGAIVRRYKELTGLKKTPMEIEKESYNRRLKSATPGVATLRSRSPALQVINETGNYLGIGLANICNILNPEMIVLGGGVAKTKTLYKPAIREMKKRALPFAKGTPIVQSKLGDKAGVIGAALLLSLQQIS